MAIPDIQLSPAQIREEVMRALRDSDVFPLIRQLQGGGLAGRKVTFGRAGGLTFPGTTSAGPFTVTHELDGVPSVVLLQAEDAAAKVVAMLGATSATTFQILLRDTTLVANSNTYTVDWLAVA
jgi:hypothetical protein